MNQSSIGLKLSLTGLLGLGAFFSMAAPAPANAFVVNIASGPAEGTWDVDFIFDRFNSNQNLLQGQLWWNDAPLANTIASAFLAQGGTADPAFANLANLNFAHSRMGNNITNRRVVFNTSSLTTVTTQFNSNQNYALAVFTPIPGPLPVFGALAAFGWSRRMRQRIRSYSL